MKERLIPPNVSPITLEEIKKALEIALQSALVGPEVESLEEDFRRYLEVKNCFATNRGFR